MPSLHARREVDIKVVVLKEVDADNVFADAGHIHYGFVDAGERG